MELNKKWKTISYEKEGRTIVYTDDYFTYKLKENELVEYINEWFIGNNRESDEGFITYDEVITLKKVDDETANSLYQEKYNPVSIFILCPTGAKFKFNEKGERLYPMKAMIHSIDDSSFGIWWDDKFTIEDLRSIRNKLMTWIDKRPVLNGEAFLKYCIDILHADSETIDYN